MVKQTRNRANVYQVNLSEGEVERLESMTRKGTLKAREMKRAQVLLMSYRQKNDAEICEALGTSTITVKRLRKTFVEQGLDAVLYDAPRSGRPSIYSGEDRAKITVLACSEHPEGHEKWSVRLLADKAVELNLVDTMSSTTVHVILKKRTRTAFETPMVSYEVDGEFIMSDGGTSQYLCAPEQPSPTRRMR